MVGAALDYQGCIFLHKGIDFGTEKLFITEVVAGPGFPGGKGGDKAENHRFGEDNEPTVAAPTKRAV